MMRALKTIALLMDYPCDDLQQHGDELAAAVAAELHLDGATREGLQGLIRRLQHGDLFEVQAEYVGLFDRSRSLSLHLFEHVHGESRDRGQAMVALHELYKQQGLAVEANELPDYLPLWLEFVSHQQPEERRAWLEEAGHLAQLLHGRLVERGSDYQWLLKGVLELAGLESAGERLQRQLREEERDDTAEALDAVWAEDPVTFGPSSGGCGARTNQGQAVPVDDSAIQRRAHHSGS